MQKITLPAPEVPVIDVATGKMNQFWYERLKLLVEALNSLLP